MDDWSKKILLSFLSLYFFGGALYVGYHLRFSWPYWTAIILGILLGLGMSSILRRYEYRHPTRSLPALGGVGLIGSVLGALLGRIVLIYDSAGAYAVAVTFLFVMITLFLRDAWFPYHPRETEQSGLNFHGYRGISAEERWQQLREDEQRWRQHYRSSEHKPRQ